MQENGWSTLRRSPFQPPPEEAARAEVEHHIEELAERLRAGGLPPAEALAEARRRFGDAERYRTRLVRTERSLRRRMRRTDAGSFVRAALLQTARTARRHPGYVAGVVLTLALGVGANAAMFSILDRLLFQPPLHVERPDEVRRIVVERSFLGRLNRSATLTFPDIEALQQLSGVTAVAPYQGTREATLGSGPDAVRVRTHQAGHELFPLLGVRPALGRFFGPEEDREGAELTAVVSHEYWRSALAGATDVLGRTLEISGQPYTVIGVAPPGFTGVDLAAVDVWLPVRAANDGYEGLRSRNYLWMRGVVRLEEAGTLPAVLDEATALHRAGHEERIARGEYDPEVRVAFDPLIAARGPEASADSKVARWLGGVSVLVLLIACANVANLLLARGTRRRREVSVRMALGAARTRMVAYLVSESLLLALVGGGVALALAGWGGALLRRVLLPGVHFPGPAVGPRLFAFTLLAALVAGVAAAVAPAVHATRTDLGRDLTGSTGSSPRRSRARLLLTAGQAGLAAILLVGAGLFVKSVGEVRRLDLGLDADRLALVTLELSTSAATGAARRAEINDLYLRAMERLAAVPGVEAVAATQSPFQWAFARDLQVEGWDSIPQLPGGGPYYHYVSPGYLETVGLAVLEGRALAAADGAGAPLVAVVSRTMARTLWPEGALGRCLYVGTGTETAADLREANRCTTVVGVVEDASRGSLTEPEHMAYYAPHAQAEGERINGLYVRIGGDPARVAAAAAAPLRALDPGVRYATVTPLRDFLDPQARSWSLGATMFTLFGLLSLLVAAIGLYSVLAFDVAQSTREIGIRTALGAARRRLLVGVLARGVGMAALGLALGLGVALLAAPLAADLLFQVSPRDPAVLAVVAVTLLAVAAAASLLPGLRATRVDAVEALKLE